MATPLLTTKLNIPPARPRLVPRPRLIECLDEGLQGRLILVSAPAGFGKTTLLVDWIHERRSDVPPLRAGWLSLDEADNDPTRFLAYLSAALRSSEEAAPRGVPGVETAHTPQAEQALVGMLNQLTALPDDLVMVLDDYHLITTQAIHDTLAFLLDHLPENLHLVMATRSDPPLHLARLRARGQLLELRQADLRFTADETAAFLNEAMGLDLAAEDVTALEARTEGWIAGLQMAALSMQGQKRVRVPGEPSEFAQALTGGHRFILDYLVEEVLDRQPAAIQEFLLKTSILDRLAGPLCDAVRFGKAEAPSTAGADAVRFGKAEAPRTAGADAVLDIDDLAVDGPQPSPTHQPVIAPFRDSQSTLEHLDSANLFIVPLDEEREWYRYHRLFGDLLRKRLGRTYPKLVPALHRRASQWLEEQGLLAAAIRHALAADDHERAADLVEEAAEATLMRSEVATLLRWVEKLPEEYVCERPALCLYHAWALFLDGRPWSEVESRLGDAVSSGDARLTPDWTAALRAYVDIYDGRAGQATERSRRALAQIPEEATLLRSLATWTLATSYLANGDGAAGLQLLEELARKSREAGNLLIAALVTCNLAELAMREGHLREAQTLYQEALDLATNAQGQRMPIAGQALIGLGELAREWNDLETAERCYLEGIELTRQWGRISAMDGYMGLARLRQIFGDEAGADKAMHEARALAVEFDATEIDDWIVGMAQAQLWAIRAAATPRYVEALERWIEQRELDDVTRFPALPDPDPSMDQRMRKYEMIVVARLRLIQRRPGEALALVDSIQPLFEERGRVRMTIEALILRALSHQLLQDQEQALASLGRALSLTQPEGYVRIFLDHGEPMRRLLKQAASRGLAPEYVRELLAAFDAPEQGRTEGAEQGVPPQPLLEPLSQRELDVLRLLGAGLSNPEIAKELYIAVSTVRSHCKSIYGKLNVHRRWDAVQRAQELGLL
jgi:LuxR family maltose regulon positive regulatory protein